MLCARFATFEITNVGDDICRFVRESRFWGHGRITFPAPFSRTIERSSDNPAPAKQIYERKYRAADYSPPDNRRTLDGRPLRACTVFALWPTVMLCVFLIYRSFIRRPRNRTIKTPTRIVVRYSHLCAANTLRTAGASCINTLYTSGRMQRVSGGGGDQ